MELQLGIVKGPHRTSAIKRKWRRPMGPQGGSEGDTLAFRNGQLKKTSIIWGGKEKLNFGANREGLSARKRGRKPNQKPTRR